GAGQERVEGGVAGRAGPDQRADLRAARRDQRAVALTDGRLLVEQPRTQQSLARRQREGALVARKAASEMAELGVVAAVLAHAVEAAQDAPPGAGREPPGAGRRRLPRRLRRAGRSWS